jgi:hypothetical protein
MPPPVLLLAGPAAAHAAGATAYITWPALMAGLSDAAIAVLLGRLAWRCCIPEWVRNDVSIKGLLLGPRRRRQDDETTDRTMRKRHAASSKELATVASVTEKIQALFATVSAKLARQQEQQQREDDGEAAVALYLRAAILAHIQLATQLRKLYPADPVLTATATYTITRSSYHDDDDKHETDTRPSTAGFAAIDYAALRQNLDFAVAAYEDDPDQLTARLGDSSFVVLQHNTLIQGGGSSVAPPGHVGHYVAVSRARKMLLVGVRGTSSLEDMITDCCGRAVPFVALEDDDLYCYGEKDVSSRIEVRAAQPHTVRVDEDDQHVEVLRGRKERIWIEEQKSHDDEYAVRCHEGIMISAKRLVDHIQRYVVQYCLRRPEVDDENNDEDDGYYQCLLCGHSLGAGVATLAAMILRARFPAFRQQEQQVQRPRLLQVVAFAPPPVLDHDSAVAAAPWVLSIVNNTDLIPRLSMANLAVFLEHMRTISDKLAEKGLQPKDMQSAIALLRKLAQPLDAVSSEADLLMSHDEVKTALRRAHQKVQLRDPDHLFVAGRVLLFVDDVLSHDDESRNDTVENSDDFDDDQLPFRCVDTDGCEPLLRHLEIDLVRMASDHVSASYYSKIEALAKVHAKKSTLV